VRSAFIETADDVQWIKDTCLMGVTLPTKYEKFKFAILQGNEDCPYAVNLYVSYPPDFDDDYYRLVFINDGLIYAECLEYCGKTNKPYGGFSDMEV
jgi:hypothetical protein